VILRANKCPSPSSDRPTGRDRNDTHEGEEGAVVSVRMGFLVARASGSGATSNLREFRETNFVIAGKEMYFIAPPGVR
jgi:hypothetical protein